MYAVCVLQCDVLIIIIVIMEICKAPTLRLRVLNKHSITHIMYVEMENVISNKNVCKKRKKRRS